MKRYFRVLVFTAILITPNQLTAQQPSPPSAWDHLEARNPQQAAEVPSLEREALELLTLDQALRFASGASISEIQLMSGESLAAFLERKSAGGVFDLSWYSIDGGGGSRMTGGDFSLIGSVGQPDAGEMVGGSFTLTGGVLAATRFEDPCGTRSAIFCDGFESGDLFRWNP